MNKIGFGFLRLPQAGEAGINWTLLNQMVDAFLAKGRSYFDTAYTYLDGMSEAAIRESLVKRYPREDFQVADKLPSWKLTSRQECYVYFEEQLKRCGVDFFDVYLLHWLNKANYEVCERYDEFGFLWEMKKAGKVGKIGFSYHDSAAFLEEILIAHPEVDIVQLQINYLDWNSSSISQPNVMKWQPGMENLLWLWSWSKEERLPICRLMQKRYFGHYRRITAWHHGHSVSHSHWRGWMWC